VCSPWVLLLLVLVLVLYGIGAAAAGAAAAAVAAVACCYCRVLTMGPAAAGAILQLNTIRYLAGHTDTQQRTRHRRYLSYNQATIKLDIV
jgi:hypothetical protein